MFTTQNTLAFIMQKGLGDKGGERDVENNEEPDDTLSEGIQAERNSADKDILSLGCGTFNHVVKSKY